MRLHQRHLAGFHAIESGRIIWIDKVRIVVGDHSSTRHRDYRESDEKQMTSFLMLDEYDAANIRLPIQQTP